MSSPVWFITGCSKGIGQAIAEEALAAGHRVVATARNSNSLSELQAKGDCLPLQLDVDKPEQITKAVQQAVEHFGQIDILVNNAGYGLTGVLEELDMQDIRKQFETNVFGLIGLTQAVLPHMRAKNQGQIYNVASLAGLRGFGGSSVYAATKFAVVGLSESLVDELAGFNIAVSSIEPGPYRTDWAGPSLQMSDEMTSGQDESPYAEFNGKIKELMNNISGNQPGDPHQIGKVLVSIVQSGKQPPKHLLFGDDAVKWFEAKEHLLKKPDFMARLPYDQTSL